MAPMATSSVHLQGSGDMAERLPLVRALHAAYTDHVGPAVALLRERADAGARLPPHVPSAESIPSPQQFAAAPNPKAQKAYTAVLLSRDWCNVANSIEDDAGRMWFMSLTHNSLGGQFLMAVPKSAFTLPSAILRTAVRFRLREAQPVALRVTCCSYGHALDEAATHYIQCRGAPAVGGGNFFISIHDTMLREVANMRCTMYPRGQVVAEDYIGAISYSPLHRPDVTILDAGGFGVHTLVELTVFSGDCYGKYDSQRAWVQAAGWCMGRLVRLWLLGRRRGGPATVTLDSCESLTPGWVVYGKRRHAEPPEEDVPPQLYPW
jgi:hypothetical protein